MDHFHLTIADLPPLGNIIKHVFVSDVAKKLILMYLDGSPYQGEDLATTTFGPWEEVNCDNPVPLSIHDAWFQWHLKVHILSDKHIPHCYFDKTSHITSINARYMDSSELAYAAVIKVASSSD